MIEATLRADRCEQFFGLARELSNALGDGPPQIERSG